MNDFYAATGCREPRPLLTRAVRLLGRTGRAIDLGAGAGADTRYLLEIGFDVVAVDADVRAAAILRRLPYQQRLTVLQRRFEQLLLERYDLVYSFLSLFFMARAAFNGFLPQLVASLTPGGVLALGLLGDHDELKRGIVADNEGWPAVDGGTFLNPEELRRMLASLEIIQLTDEYREMRFAGRGIVEKHLVSVIARRHD